MLAFRRKFDHNTPARKHLHWLPVEQKSPLIYKSLHGKAPAYLSQLLSLYTSNKPLQSGIDFLSKLDIF